jgi:predicted component of viral defense system (DUF524 family)
LQFPVLFRRGGAKDEKEITSENVRKMYSYRDAMAAKGGVTKKRGKKGKARRVGGGVDVGDIMHVDYCAKDAEERAKRFGISMEF